MEELSDNLYYCPKRKLYLYRNDMLFVQFARLDKPHHPQFGTHNYANIRGNVITYALAVMGNKLGTVSLKSTKVSPLLPYEEWDDYVKEALVTDWQGNQNLPLIITRLNESVDKSNRRN